MGFIDRILGRKRVDQDARRRWLLETGRITDGVIIDVHAEASGDEVAFYHYSLNGVEFESSEVLTPEQRRQPVSYAPGAKVAVRYDPRNQGNSILV